MMFCFFFRNDYYNLFLLRLLLAVLDSIRHGRFLNGVIIVCVKKTLKYMLFGYLGVPYVLYMPRGFLW